MSVLPPAPNGTITVTGRAGQSAAWSGAASAARIATDRRVRTAWIDACRFPWEKSCLRALAEPHRASRTSHRLASFGASSADAVEQAFDIAFIFLAMAGRGQDGYTMPLVERRSVGRIELR